MSKIGRHFFDFKPPPHVVLRSFSSRLDSDEAAFKTFTSTPDCSDVTRASRPSRRRRAQERWEHKRRKMQLEAAAAGIDTRGLWDRGSHVIRLLARQRYVQQAEFIIPQEGADKLRGSERLDNPFVVDGNGGSGASDESEDDGFEGFVALDASHGKAVGGTALRVAAELGADSLNEACFYVVTGPLCDLLAPPFLQKYILGRDDGDGDSDGDGSRNRSRHCFRALSRNSEVDHCNCVSISPRGILVLLVDQATYERLGLCGVPAARSQRRRSAGQQHSTSVKWFRIAIDLRSEAYAVGSPGHARLVWALNPLRIPPTTLYVSWDAAPPAPPSEVVFPPSFSVVAPPSHRKLATSSYALEKVFIPEFRAGSGQGAVADQSSVARSRSSRELAFIDGSSDEEQEQGTTPSEHGPSGGDGSPPASLVSVCGGDDVLPPAIAHLEHDWCGIVALRLQSILQQKPGPSGPLPMSDRTEMAAYSQPIAWRGETSRLTCFRWTGFISTSRLTTFFRRARTVLADNPSLPWVGMAVWGFADTTSTWQHPVPSPKQSRAPTQNQPPSSHHRQTGGGDSTTESDRSPAADGPSPSKRSKQERQKKRQKRPGAGGGHAPSVSRDHSFHFGGENDFLVIVFQDGTYHAIGAIAAQDC